MGFSGATHYRRQSDLKSCLYLQNGSGGVKYPWNDDAAVPDPINAGTMGFVATRVPFFMSGRCMSSLVKVPVVTAGFNWSVSAPQ